jgi:hypothetical protein
MKQIKSLGFVLVFIAVILIFVLVRNSEQNLFKQDPQLAIEKSENNGNLISLAELQNRETHFLLVDLNEENSSDLLKLKNPIHLPFSNLLEKENRIKLKDADEIILYSNDVSESAKAWVILNQLDFKKVFIFSNEENPEVLKYEFQPDTTARLE